MKKRILVLFAHLAYKYGMEGAKQPSYRGTFEAEVPKALAISANSYENRHHSLYNNSFLRRLK